MFDLFSVCSNETTGFPTETVGFRDSFCQVVDNQQLLVVIKMSYNL